MLEYCLVSMISRLHSDCILTVNFSELTFTVFVTASHITALGTAITQTHCFVIDTSAYTGNRCQCFSECREETARRLPVFKLAVFTFFQFLLSRRIFYLIWIWIKY